MNGGLRVEAEEVVVSQEESIAHMRKFSEQKPKSSPHAKIVL